MSRRAFSPRRPAEKKARVRHDVAAGFLLQSVRGHRRDERTAGGLLQATRYCISVIAADIVAIATATERELRFAARPRSPFNWLV